MITPDTLRAQEEVFAGAFAAHDLSGTRPLYHSDVIYISPTVRLFGWPARIDGIDRTLQFIDLTIRYCEAITYRAVEQASVADGTSAFVRIQFDWSREGHRLRSNYVVIYRYCDTRIARQELYYDPSAPPEMLPESQR